MCNSKNGYYDILQRLRKKLLSQDIQITLKALSKYDIDEKAKWLMAAILAGEYTQRTIIATNIIENYTQCRRTHIPDITKVARGLQKLQGETFNRFIELSANIMNSRDNGIRAASLFIGTIKNGDLECIGNDITEKLDYSGRVLAQFKKIMPEYKVSCEICNADKPINDYEIGYTYCNACREKHDNGQRSVLKVRIAREMALEAANSIKKDI